MKPSIFKIPLLLLALHSGSLMAQQKDSSNFMLLSLEELMNVPITIASMKKQSQEDAPSIITVISSKDIQDYGYKDLADVFRRIPGFEFGVDVQNLFGLGVRGIWAHEGKALIMINNMSINCFGFGNGNFFGTFPISMVDRIEIIRGPGSAIYGGFAEVAVINIVTKKGDQLNGAEIGTSMGFINSDPAINGTISVGIADQKKNSFSATITSNQTPLSNQVYNDFYSGSYKMGAESSWRKFRGIYLTGELGNLKIGYNRSYTNFMAQDGFGAVVPQSVAGKNTNQLNNITESFNSSYQISASKNTSIIPRLEIASGNPISTAVNPNASFNGADPWQNQSALGSRVNFQIDLDTKLSDRSNLIGGLGYQYNKITSLTQSGNPGLKTSANPSDTVSSYAKGTQFAFLQYSYQADEFGVTVGSRYEVTPFGNAYAPRIGLTYKKEKFNSKLLYGRAFRVPLFWQTYSRQFFDPIAPLKPEFTDSYELELGYRFSPNIKLKSNLFFIDVTSPIVYLGSNNSYNNFGRIQSQGVEAELQVRYSSYGGFANVSYNLPGSATSREFLDASKKYFLGLPTLKVNLGFHLYVWRLTWSPSVTYIGERYGQSQYSAQNSTASSTIFETVKYNGLALVNSNLVLKLSDAYQINFSVYNVLNQNYQAIQPYYGGHAPLPVADRQINFGLRVKI